MILRDLFPSCLIEELSGLWSRVACPDKTKSGVEKELQKVLRELYLGMK